MVGWNAYFVYLCGDRSSEEGLRLSIIPHGTKYIEYLSLNMMEHRGFIVLVGAGSNELMDIIEADLMTIRHEEDIILVTDIEREAIGYTLDDVLMMFNIEQLPTVIYAHYGEIISTYDNFDDYNVESMRLWLESISVP